MITFSTAIQNILAQPVVEEFHLVRIGNYRTTSYFYNITLSNGDVYLADGKLVGVDTPRLSSTVDRELYKVTLADNDYSLSTVVEGSFVGLPFEVRIGFVDQTTKQPLTTITDTLLAYKGIIDSGGYSINPADVGDVILQVTGASPMADLDATRTFYGSKDFIRSLAPNDSSFDQVYEGSGPVSLKWGKG